MEENNDIEKIEGIDLHYLEAYFGKYSYYYLPLFKSLSKGKVFSFNLWAFLMALPWLLVKRLYIHALVFIGASYLSSVIILLSTEANALSPNELMLINMLESFILSTILGLLGNYFYLKQAKKLIQLILSKKNDEKTRLELLQKAGSNNWNSLIILGIIIVVILILNR